MYVNDDILGREQAGFRDGYSTIDHAFVLHLVIERYQSVRKRVFCAFIDFHKAFDSIDRSLLWQKFGESTHSRIDTTPSENHFIDVSQDVESDTDCCDSA